MAHVTKHQKAPHYHFMTPSLIGSWRRNLPSSMLLCTKFCWFRFFLYSQVYFFHLQSKSLWLPQSKETTHLSTAEFALFDASNASLTYVANISRGATVDQPALVSALHANQLRGAALDVTDPEPLPPDDSLWSTPNVVITPHVSRAALTTRRGRFRCSRRI